jgi:hypothetical protein
MRVLKAISGLAFVAFGLLGCAVSLLAIIDPVGTKMSDDGDPFGTPPSIMSCLVLLAVFVAVSALGAYLLSRLRSSRNDA